MKKIAITAGLIAGLVVVAGIAVFVLPPKEFRIELGSEDLQKKAGEKFPQIIGKAMKLEMPSLSKSSFPAPPKSFDKPTLPEPPALPERLDLPKPPGASRLPDLPRLPKPPKKPSLPEPPRLPDSPLPQYLLTGITLHTPTLTLVDSKLHIAFERIDIRMTGDYLFEFAPVSELPYDSEYIPVAEGVRAQFSKGYVLTEQAVIKHSGKDSWLIRDGGMEYMLAQEAENIRVFATKKGGTEVRGVSAKAQAKLSGELVYERDTHTVFFQSLDIYEFTIEKLARLGAVPADMIQEKIKNQINTVLKEEQRIPVVDLKDTAKEQQPKMVRVLSKLFLEELVIKDSKLTIILSLRK